MDQVDKRLDNLKQTQNEIDAKVKDLKYLESLRDELDLKRMTLKANEDALKRKVESEMQTIDAERKKLSEAEKKLKRMQNQNQGAKKLNEDVENGNGNGNEKEVENLQSNSKRDTPKKKF